LHIAQRSQLEHQGCCRFIVGGLEEEQAVKGAERPENVCDLDPQLLGAAFQRRRPLGGVLNVRDTLGREPDCGNKGGHRQSSGEESVSLRRYSTDSG
jgi:hypothetical protein